MNILLVYPEFLVTFWSWNHVLKFIGKKAALPPLGLLTVAAILPESWEKKLVDTNVHKLTDGDIGWADYVFISAMIAQKDSTKEIIARCKNWDKPVILGGPILEIGYDEFPGVDSFFVGEAEGTLLKFLEDLKTGSVERVYSSTPKSFPDITTSPIPLWGLINPKHYACLLVQYIRGCPFGCTFCGVAEINGRVPRAKLPEQFLLELDAIKQTGFRGSIMFADDNFIGDKRKAKELLHKLILWQQFFGYPFEFTAEVDITLADDHELMELMVQAGFKKVFLGIETPSRASLVECHKFQNLFYGGEDRDLADCVKTIQNHGLHPMSGFIVGFDSDDPATIFDEHISFYQRTGIVFPMVGVLQAPRGTKVFDKLQKEGRLRTEVSGNNTDCYPNFRPRMPVKTLVEGYKRIMRTTYSPKKYYERIRVFLGEYNTGARVFRWPSSTQIRALITSIWRIGLLGGPITSWYYWKTMLLAGLKYRQAFSEAMALQIFGFHFRRIAKTIQKS